MIKLMVLFCLGVFLFTLLGSTMLAKGRRLQ